ncbi:MAG: hypothetical protein R3293_28755, partial [Candidatus Promineifilaceae bacterium]|nr:hypothetical protein [Candidatus Promineifilaceae bacterium]
MNFVIAGGLRTDYIITQEEKVHLGLPGGNAVFASAGATLWTKAPDRTTIWARYGENFPSNWLNTLADLGLDTSGLICIPGN